MPDYALVPGVVGEQQGMQLCKQGLRVFRAARRHGYADWFIRRLVALCVYIQPPRAEHPQPYIAKGSGLTPIRLLRLQIDQHLLHVEAAR
jgi:hypothetical protein